MNAGALSAPQPPTRPTLYLPLRQRHRFLSGLRPNLLFLSGEPDAAGLMLRDLVNATLGFGQLAQLTHKPSKSLHRMLSPKGNPSMYNLAAIFDAVRNQLNVTIEVRIVEAA